MAKNGKKILVVDDESSILEVIQMMLEDAGFRVETTTKDGEYVVQSIQKEMPDLIILDVLLSGQDGRTICKKLKSQDKTKGIPVIMISAHVDAEKAVKECGAQDFIAKPFDMNELIEKAAKYAL